MTVEVALNLSPPPNLLAASSVRPAGVPVSGTPGRDSLPDAPDGSANPFSALLLGFLQAAQPAAPVPATGDAAPLPGDGTQAAAPVSNLPGSADATSLLPGRANPAVGLPDALPTAAGTAPTPAAAGKDLPLTGMGLPPGDPAAGLPSVETGSGAPAAAPGLDLSGLVPAAAPAPTPPPAAPVPLSDLDLAKSLDLDPDLSDANALPALAEAPGTGGEGADTTDGFRDFLSRAIGAGANTADVAATMPTVPSALAAALFTRPGEVPGLDAGSSRSLLDGASGPSATGSGTVTATGSGTSPAGSAGSPGADALMPLGDGGSFASGLGDRLLSLNTDGLQSARIRLHPEHLGPLDVRIRVEDGAAQVWFSTNHAGTRDAIENSLPRLREMFASQGMELLQAQVGSGDPRQGQGGGAAMGGDQPAPRNPAFAFGGETRTSATPRDYLAVDRPGGRAAERLLDVYA